MDIAQARKRANHAVWIGSEAIYVWHKKDASVERVELPPAGPVPYVPRFQGVWEEASQKAFQSQLTSALGGLRIRMSDILVAIPDDATWIETRALQDFFLMSGSGAPDKKLFFYSQSVLLGPSEHSFIAVTWSCRCFSVCLIQTALNRTASTLPPATVSRRIWTQPSGLSTLAAICRYIIQMQKPRPYLKYPGPLFLWASFSHNKDCANFQALEEDTP